MGETDGCRYSLHVYDDFKVSRGHTFRIHLEAINYFLWGVLAPLLSFLSGVS